MQEISNSLRERLGARPQPETHPDPDALSAYVEQVLSPAERSRIIEHLADCRDCREVVALSLPQLEQPQPVLQVAPRSRWWTPAYRWATLAATVAVAATLIVERPWKRETPATSARTEQIASAGKNEPANSSTNQAASSPAVTAPATSSRASTIGPRMSAAPTPFVERFPEPQGRAELRSRKMTENIASAPPAPGIVGGAVGGLPSNDKAQTQRNVTLESDLVADERASAPAAQKAEFVNRNAAGQQSAAAGETLSLNGTNQAVLPIAPKPQPVTQGAADVHKLTPPPLSATNTQNAFATEIVPPNVSPSQPPPSAEDSNLKTTRNFGDKKGKSKIETAKSKVVEAAKTVMEAANPVKPPSGAAQGFAGGAMAAPSKKPGDSRPEFRRELQQQPQWTITPEGHLLVKSDAVSQWHEAYTQSPDVQFRVVQPRGWEVWAGGNHGTLVHSWNAGVDWSKMNVPASTASDITDISIDGDNVQVKTSNGQSFVSTDHGQTWVPLEQPK